jgi:hypothetical protein
MLLFMGVVILSKDDVVGNTGVTNVHSSVHSHQVQSRATTPFDVVTLCLSVRSDMNLDGRVKCRAYV